MIIKELKKGLKSGYYGEDMRKMYNEKLAARDNFENKIRKTEYYKNLTPYLAAMAAEGSLEGEGANEDQIIAAYQYIVDNKMDLWLQGTFGRIARDLINNDLIEARN